jgi:metal-responsive CopG/Arc/MetJ family transcriptional regulator
MNGYTSVMKTAISVPNDDFERFERVANKHGMNRSEFYRVAAQRLADELEGASELTAIANAVLARAGQPSGDGIFLKESERSKRESIEW